MSRFYSFEGLVEMVSDKKSCNNIGFTHGITLKSSRLIINVYILLNTGAAEKRRCDPLSSFNSCSTSCETEKAGDEKSV